MHVPRFIPCAALNGETPRSLPLPLPPPPSPLALYKRRGVYMYIFCVYEYTQKVRALSSHARTDRISCLFPWRLLIGPCTVSLVFVSAYLCLLPPAPSPSSLLWLQCSTRLLARGRGAFLAYRIMILVGAFMHKSDWFIVRDGKALFRLTIRLRAWICQDYLNTQIIL